MGGNSTKNEEATHVREFHFPDGVGSSSLGSHLLLATDGWTRMGFILSNISGYPVHCPVLDENCKALVPTDQSARLQLAQGYEFRGLHWPYSPPRRHSNICSLHVHHAKKT